MGFGEIVRGVSNFLTRGDRERATIRKLAEDVNSRLEAMQTIATILVQLGVEGAPNYPYSVETYDLDIALVQLGGVYDVPGYCGQVKVDLATGHVVQGQEYVRTGIGRVDLSHIGE